MVVTGAGDRFELRPRVILLKEKRTRKVSKGAILGTVKRRQIIIQHIHVFSICKVDMAGC